MNKNKYYFQIAGFNFCIIFCDTEWEYQKNKLKNEILNYLDGFIIDGKPVNIDYRIDCIWEDNIRNISLKHQAEYYVNFYKIKDNNRIDFYYRNSILQFQMVISTILFELLTKNNGFLLHASASNSEGKAIVFLGQSGAGKSTIVKLLHDKYPALADDMVIIRKEKKAYFLYQTPFFEKGYRTDKSPFKYKLDRIFILNKAEYFKIVKLEKRELILKHIIEGLGIRKDFIRRQMKNGLDLVFEYKNFYNIYFTKDRNKISNLIGKGRVKNYILDAAL